MSSIIDPNVWGKYYWYTMESIACTADLKDNATLMRTIEFYNSLQFLLPCEECREHYKAYMAKHPIDEHTQSNATLYNWVKQLQKSINIQKTTIAIGTDTSNTDSPASSPSSPALALNYQDRKQRLIAMRRNARRSMQSYKESRKIRNDFEALERKLEAEKKDQCCSKSSQIKLKYLKK